MDQIETFPNIYILKSAILKEITTSKAPSVLFIGTPFSVNCISRYSLGNFGLAEAILVFNITGFFVNFWFDFRTNLYPGSPRLNGYWRPRIC